MKIVRFILAFCLFSLGSSLQSPYLSTLNGGASATISSPSGMTAMTSAVPSQELVQLWSSQVSVELAASQLYLSASIWFRARDMDGMAAWMLGESAEERGHGLQILEFAMKKGFPVELHPLHAPRADWTHPVQVWEDILNAEQTNTQNLLKLAAVASTCGDYAAKAFLGPFHIEQLEAEDKVSAILAKVREASPSLLMELDHQLGVEAEEEDHH
jgi:ferritin